MSILWGIPSRQGGRLDDLTRATWKVGSRSGQPGATLRRTQAASLWRSTWWRPSCMLSLAEGVALHGSCMTGCARFLVQGAELALSPTGAYTMQPYCSRVAAHPPGAANVSDLPHLPRLHLNDTQSLLQRTDGNAFWEQAMAQPLHACAGVAKGVSASDMTCAAWP